MTWYIDKIEDSVVATGEVNYDVGYGIILLDFFVVRNWVALNESVHMLLDMHLDMCIYANAQGGWQVVQLRGLKMLKVKDSSKYLRIDYRMTYLYFQNIKIEIFSNNTRKRMLK